MEIDVDKIQFAADVDRVIKSLHALGGAVENRSKMDLLRNEVLSRGLLNEGDYLELADEILSRVTDKIDDDLVAKLCLDLSRLHCGVRDLYDAKGIVPKLLEIAAKNPLDYTEYNQVIIQDFTYSYYYWKAKHILSADGIEALARFLKEDSYLQTKNGKQIAESILLSLISVTENKTQTISLQG